MESIRATQNKFTKHFMFISGQDIPQQILLIIVMRLASPKATRGNLSPTNIFTAKLSATSVSKEKPLMDTFLNDFRMRTEIKERCGIRIAKTDQSHNKPYINLVAKIEGYLYNVYCLAANMNVSEINDLNNIVKPKQELFNSMCALICMVSGADKTFPTDFIFKKSLDWVHVQSFFNQHFLPLQSLLSNFQDLVQRTRVKSNNMIQAAKFMKPVLGRTATDYYLDRDAATTSPLDDRLYDMAWHALEFYHGYRELEEMNLKLGKVGSQATITNSPVPLSKSTRHNVDPSHQPKINEPQQNILEPTPQPPTAPQTIPPQTPVQQVPTVTSPPIEQPASPRVRFQDEVDDFNSQRMEVIQNFLKPVEPEAAKMDFINRFLKQESDEDEKPPVRSPIIKKTMTESIKIQKSQNEQPRSVVDTKSSDKALTASVIRETTDKQQLTSEIITKPLIKEATQQQSNNQTVTKPQTKEVPQSPKGIITKSIVKEHPPQLPNIETVIKPTVKESPPQQHNIETVIKSTVKEHPPQQPNIETVIKSTVKESPPQQPNIEAVINPTIKESTQQKEFPKNHERIKSQTSQQSEKPPQQQTPVARSPEPVKKADRLSFPGQVSYESKQPAVFHEYKPKETKKKSSNEVRAEIAQHKREKVIAAKVAVEDNARKDYEAQKLRVLERTQGLKQETMALVTDQPQVEVLPTKVHSMDPTTFEIMTNSKHVFHDIMDEDFYKSAQSLNKQKTMEMAATLPEQAEDEEADQEEVQQPKKPVNFLKANKVIKKKVHKKQNDVSLKPRVPESRMETPEKKPTTKVVQSQAKTPLKSPKRDSIYMIDQKLDFLTPKKPKEPVQFGKRHDKQASIEKYKRRREEEERKQREEEERLAQEKLQQEEQERKKKRKGRSTDQSRLDSSVNVTKLSKSKLAADEDRNKRMEQQWETLNKSSSQKRPSTVSSFLAELNTPVIVPPSPKKTRREQKKEEEDRRRKEEEEELQRIRQEQEEIRRKQEQEELERKKVQEVVQKRRLSKLHEQQSMIQNLLAEQLKKQAQPSPQEAKRRESKREELNKLKDERMQQMLEQVRQQEEERRRIEEEQARIEAEKKKLNQSQTSTTRKIKAKPHKSPDPVSRESGWSTTPSKKKPSQLDTPPQVTPPQQTPPSQSSPRKQSITSMPSEASPRQLQVIAQKQNRFTANIDTIEEENKSSFMDRTEQVQVTTIKPPPLLPKKKEVHALSKKEIAEMNLDDLEEQLEKEMRKTDKEIKRLQTKEHKLLWQEKRALKQLTRVEGKFQREDQLKWNERQSKKQQRLLRKQEEIERNFLLENSGFRIELLSPRAEHNNKRYDMFDERKRSKGDQEIERIARIKTLQLQLKNRISNIKQLEGDIKNAKERLYVQDSDESLLSASSLTEDN